MEELRAKFQEIFANLPSSMRNDVVVVINEKPYSWNSAHIEISTKTELGDKMLKILEELGIL